MVPGDAAVVDVGAVVVGAVEEREPAVVEPPARLPLRRAVRLPPPVVVAVRGGEGHAVVAVQRVLRAARVPGDRQLVLVALARHPERGVAREHPVPGEVPHVHPQLVVVLLKAKARVII